MERSIFISYSSSEKAVAEQICASLEASGLGCWIAPRDIEPGADYPAAILGGIHQARALVVVVSAASVASPHILSEVGHAFSEKKPIIPFRLAATELPPDLDYFLSMSQWLDAHDGCTPENLARLKEAVARAQIGRVGAVPGRKARLDKRALLSAALALVVVGAVFYWRWPSHTVKTDDPTAGTKIVPPLNNTDDKKDHAPENKPQPWVNPKDGLIYVWIPPGAFMMGCSAGDTECKPDEGPSHMVELPAGFWLGQTEVTNAAYRRVRESWKFPPNESNLPAVDVSWRDAKSYCATIGGRLPTEAEWEYAARGGLPSAYYGVPSKIAWFAGNSGGVRHEVATRQPNAYGLYDTLGNASEWVLDRYYKKYSIEDPAIGAVDEPLAGNASALTRGGFWESEAENIRVSRRAEMDSSETGPMAGIRCVAARK
jgi:formylglycine-generating enzyme required for sulfatase activity